MLGKLYNASYVFPLPILKKNLEWESQGIPQGFSGGLLDVVVRQGAPVLNIITILVLGMGE